ncbi:hypothetical protein [Fervidobacterium sp. 2310opik-2]|uniref:hypothetical protein n=1 Tax=Fervidobacterium sp. 2310opik-2 TaxID=1755815 RepID=UPI0013DFF74C|nr:hypothetical protein [Fervidobacterium sp. 2310opik-2]KAF2961801.1 hypothetical protein AS161_06795 [Fervidobacterium sp. 2310opik-2]
MKFFYNIERIENYEYIVVKVEENNISGTGAILPIRRKGENYKIFMGVIEEYRTIIEHSKAEDVFLISKILEKHFPNHPKVVFGIQAAMLSLFSKKYQFNLNQLIGGPEVPKNEKCGELVFPEELGDVMLAKYVNFIDSETKSDKTFVMTRYPKDEMGEVLSALSTNYKYLEVVSWKELL